MSYTDNSGFDSCCGSECQNYEPTCVNKYFCSDTYTPVAQIFASFVFGAIFAPWSWGILFLIIYFIIYEILFYIFTKGDPKYWQPETRLAVFCSYILGWIVIRTIIEDSVFESEVPMEDTYSADILSKSVLSFASMLG